MDIQTKTLRYTRYKKKNIPLATDKRVAIIRLIAKVLKNKKGPKSITLGVLKFKHDIPKKNHGLSRKANQKTHYIQRNYWFNSLGVPSSNKKTDSTFQKKVH